MKRNVVIFCNHSTILLWMNVKMKALSMPIVFIEINMFYAISINNRFPFLLMH